MTSSDPIRPPMAVRAERRRQLETDRKQGYRVAAATADEQMRVTVRYARRLTGRPAQLQLIVAALCAGERPSIKRSHILEFSLANNRNLANFEWVTSRDPDGQTFVRAVCNCVVGFGFNTCNFSLDLCQTDSPTTEPRCRQLSRTRCSVIESELRGGCPVQQQQQQQPDGNEHDMAEDGHTCTWLLQYHQRLVEAQMFAATGGDNNATRAIYNDGYQMWA